LSKQTAVPPHQIGPNIGDHAPSSWYTTFFRGVSLEFWNAAVNPLAPGEAAYLKKMLNARKGAKLLDVPCGNGRHAVELAAMGFQITGVDISKEQLELARSLAHIRGVKLELREIDKCALPYDAEFAGAYCCGNSFGYVDDDGIEKFVAGVSRALKPGARFIIDTAMAAESIIPNLDESWWMQAGDVHVMIHNEYEVADSRLHTTLKFLQNGKLETREIYHRVYTVMEIRKLLERHAFTLIALHADIDAKPYELSEPQLWITAEKQN
jgi:SAM-dependent methyltransferase